MSHLTVLIPFALPPAAMAPDLIKSMQTPSLAMLLGRSRSELTSESDAFARSLPHEYWLAEAAGLDIDPHKRNSPAVAAHSLARFKSAPKEGVWFVLNPVHIHVARDHLVLTDQRRLALDEIESQELFALAEPVFAEYGHSVLYGDATTWFLRADEWHDLQTSTPDAACGHNIDIWMPTGSAERAWRKLQNEIQMHWHDTLVNQQRQSIGKNPVNSLWLWGGAQAPKSASLSCYENVLFTDIAMQYFGAVARNTLVSRDVAAMMNSAPVNTLLVLNNLIEPALGEDLGEWLLRINALEEACFAPILDALKSGRISQCRFILTNESSIRECSVSRNALRKFWQAPSLAGLIK